MRPSPARVLALAAATCAASALAQPVPGSGTTAEPPGRIADLANSRRFAAFVAEELLPCTRAHYAVTRAADRTIVAGSSAGGLAAAYVALAYPALFGNVLSQSGAFWRGDEGSNAPPYESLTQRYAESPTANLRFFLDVGSAVAYYEVPGGTHSPESWRARLPVGIVTLAPASGR